MCKNFNNWKVLYSGTIQNSEEKYYMFEFSISQDLKKSIKLITSSLLTYNGLSWARKFAKFQRDIQLYSELEKSTKERNVKIEIDY